MADPETELYSVLFPLDPGTFHLRGHQSRTSGAATLLPWRYYQLTVELCIRAISLLRWVPYSGSQAGTPPHLWGTINLQTTSVVWTKDWNPSPHSSASQEMATGKWVEPRTNSTILIHILAFAPSPYLWLQEPRDPNPTKPPTIDNHKIQLFRQANRTAAPAWQTNVGLQREIT